MPRKRGFSALAFMFAPCSLEHTAETTGSGLVPIGLLTGKSTREMILRAATKSAAAQAAVSVCCARKTSSCVLAVV